MAWQGWDLKLGDYIVPYSFMRAETYKGIWNSQDVDSYRDNDGILHRNALPTRATKIEFNTPTMTGAKMQEFLGNIRRNYIDAVERKLLATFYVDELDEYKTDYVYMPDPEFTKYSTANGIIMYKETRFAFIGYGIKN